MPKIAVYRFLTFFIFAYDALNEPPHLHAVKEKGQRQRSAKIWLQDSSIAETGTLSAEEIILCLKLIEANRTTLINHFNAVKEGRKVKTLQLKMKP